VPFAMGHYVENTGEETLRFLEMFRSPYFADVSLNQWMASATAIATCRSDWRTQSPRTAD
jgi:oxalate decarboxylase/phosphoglucose isomerase-like protein (cupin superfamily)